MTGKTSNTDLIIYSWNRIGNECHCFSLKERMIPLRVNDELILNGEFDRKNKLVSKIHKDLTFPLSKK